MKVGTGEAYCKGCGYEYKPGKGDPEYPISAGTYFQASHCTRCLHWHAYAATQTLLFGACGRQDMYS